MTELLSGDVPCAYIWQAQHLLGLCNKYGSPRVEAACSRALAFGLMNLSRVERINPAIPGTALVPAAPARRPNDQRERQWKPLN